VGNYRLGAIDQFGNRTRTWEMLQRINNEIHALAPTLIKLRSTGVYHYPDVPEQGTGLGASRLVKSVEMTQRYVRPPVGARFLIGEFEDAQGRPYFMIVNKDPREFSDGPRIEARRRLVFSEQSPSFVIWRRGMHCT
jgi:hypothetical protein